MENSIENTCFMYRCTKKQDKLLRVPYNRYTRKKWFEYAGRPDYITAPSLTFSCETHYNEVHL